MIQSAAALKSFKENGHRLALIKRQLVDFAQTHLDKAAIEAKAVALIKAAGGQPAFMRVPGYHWATCISVNHEIVHGIPQGKLRPGDLVTLDLGMYYQETTSDSATSFVIGSPTPDQARFLSVGQKTLRKAVKAAKTGNQVRDITKVIQRHLEIAGYSAIRTLSGHGLGKTLHEEPYIPCFLSSDPILSTRLQSGMVLAIEVMYAAGGWRLVIAPDGWTQKTQDGSLSAVFEDDVIVGPQPENITAFPLVPQV